MVRLYNTSIFSFRVFLFLVLNVWVPLDKIDTMKLFSALPFCCPKGNLFCSNLEAKIQLEMWCETLEPPVYITGNASLQDAIKLESVDSGVTRAEKGEWELIVDLTSEYQIYGITRLPSLQEWEEGNTGRPTWRLFLILKIIVKHHNS